jgi:hypothetical protein
VMNFWSLIMLYVTIWLSGAVLVSGE